MPLIGTPLSHILARCERCNSKRREIIGKTERIKNDNGVSVIEHSQIICTNAECQFLFEKVLVAEEKKRTALQLEREENSLRRKSLRGKKSIVI